MRREQEGAVFGAALQQRPAGYRGLRLILAIFCVPLRLVDLNGVMNHVAAKYCTPYMVENHSCCSAFIHMMPANVRVMANAKMPQNE